jgi:hypothetical protein
VAQRLAELSAEERAGTAVVLADEALLLPFLEQLPADIGPMNVTMGMPLKALPVNGLTEAFLRVHSSMAQDGSILVKDFEALLSHPFLNEGGATTAVIRAVRLNGTVRSRSDAILDAMRNSGSSHSEQLSKVLEPLNADLMGLPSRFIALFTWAKELAGVDKSVREQLFQMARLQQRLDRTLARFGHGGMDLRTYSSVREKLLRDERIAFLGEPLRGLQVMGLLETRALDHERLFLVSMNEGTLPTSNSQQSWIPYDVRRHHKLPLPSDGEAISAYHFQRAMHQARQVELVHHTGGDGGEASRFLAQWKKEVVGHSSTAWTEHFVTGKGVLRRPRPIVVKKDKATIAKLKELCERGLSPSALGTWLRCPLDFHFKYVLGIKEEEAADGSLGSDVLGNAVHEVLQDLFKPLVGHVLSPEILGPMPEQVDRLLHDQLARSFTSETLAHGHFRLRHEMAAQALRSYLAAEQKRCERSTTNILGIEQVLKGVLPNGVVMKGRTDRVDQRDGLTMVLDVKTGSVRPEDLRLNDLTRDSIDPNKRYALQLLTYVWTYMQEHPDVEQVSAGVIPLQRASQADGEFLTVGKNPILQRSQMGVMAELLSTLVEEMLDPERAFMHDPDSTYCRFCVA